MHNLAPDLTGFFAACHFIFFTFPSILLVVVLIYITHKTEMGHAIHQVAGRERGLGREGGGGGRLKITEENRL